MTRSRWIAFAVACLLVAAAAFGAGTGTVALFSESETVSGTFTVSHGGNATGDLPANATAPGNGTDGENATPGAQNETGGDDGPPGNNGTVPGNESDGGNSTDDGNGTGSGNTTEESGNASDGDASADLAVTGIALSETNVSTGEIVAVAVSVENTGNATGIYEAALAVNGTEATTGSLEVGPGTESTLTLRHEFDAPGSYVLGLNDGDVGSVRVVEPSGNAAAQ